MDLGSKSSEAIVNTPTPVQKKVCFSSTSQLQFITDVFSVTKKVSKTEKLEETDVSKKEPSISTYSIPSRMRIKASYTPDLYLQHKYTAYETIIGTFRVDSNLKMGRNSYTTAEFNEFKNKLLKNG